MSPDRLDALNMIDEVNLQLGRASALLAGAVALEETGDVESNTTVLVYLAEDSVTAAFNTINEWWASLRREDESAEAPQDTSGHRPRHRTDRFDHQFERAGSCRDGDRICGLGPHHWPQVRQSGS